MKKDSLTGTEVIDYDFLGKKLYPPRKLKETDATKAVAMLFKELDSFYYPSKKKEKHKDFFAFVGRRGGRGRGEQKQPCMVKMFYTDSKKAHKEFLRNYMPQKNRKEVEDKPELFNEEYDEVPEEVILDYEENMDKRGFKFIISPESQKVPMKELVRQFVKNLENATGFKFTWLAVVHTNTEHIHSHLLINGIDKKTGKKIERFPPEIIKSVSREMASNICTALVGERSSEQIENSEKLTGLGTQATRHTFIPELLKNGYIKIENKNIIITSIGKIVINAVRNSSIKRLSNIEETTNWEKQLEENPKEFEKSINDFVLSSVKENFRIDVFSDLNEEKILCPNCKNLIKSGITKNGFKNWFCSGYKQGCNFKIWENFNGIKLTKKDVSLLCKKQKTPLKSFISKNGKAYKARLYLDSNNEIKFDFKSTKKN